MVPYYECEHPENSYRDLVYGKIFYRYPAQELRSREKTHLCGAQGQWFEPKK